MGEIISRQDGFIGHIIIANEKKLNALNEEMWCALPRHLKALEENDGVRVIVVSGAGDKAFSAGADISEFGSLRSGDAAEHYNALNTSCFEALRTCAKPTISMISGYCLGGGFLIAFATDIRLASNNSKYSLPPAKLGIGFDARWLVPLMETCSPQFAKELLFRGSPFSAERLIAHGLLNALFDESNLETETLSIAGEIAANAPLTITSLKRSIDVLSRDQNKLSFEELDLLRDKCFASDDYREGQAAFFEKRRPLFNGR